MDSLSGNIAPTEPSSSQTFHDALRNSIAAAGITGTINSDFDSVSQDFYQWKSLCNGGGPYPSVDSIDSSLDQLIFDLQIGPYQTNISALLQLAQTCQSTLQDAINKFTGPGWKTQMDLQSLTYGSAPFTLLQKDLAALIASLPSGILSGIDKDMQTVVANYTQFSKYIPDLPTYIINGGDPSVISIPMGTMNTNLQKLVADLQAIVFPAQGNRKAG